MSGHEPLHRDSRESPYVPRAELLVGAELVAVLESEALPAAVSTPNGSGRVCPT